MKWIYIVFWTLTTIISSKKIPDYDNYGHRNVNVNAVNYTQTIEEEFGKMFKNKEDAIKFIKKAPKDCSNFNIDSVYTEEDFFEPETYSIPNTKVILK